MKHTEFFREVNGCSIGGLVNQRQAGFTIEEMYQAFKDVPVCPVYGCMVDSQPQKPTCDGSAEEIGGP